MSYTPWPFDACMTSYLDERGNFRGCTNPPVRFFYWPSDGTINPLCTVHAQGWPKSGCTEVSREQAEAYLVHLL
jgi:hypothetical protein